MLALSSSNQTLASAYQSAKQTLREAHLDSPHATPDLDARLLIAAACGLDDHAPLLHGEMKLSQIQCETIESAISRRAAGEPVARIVGQKGFWGLDFIINEHTLIPRPETEGIVEGVVEWARGKGRQNDALRIVDIGTGSGAILVSLLHELPQAIGVGVDISKAALDVALENAERHEVSERFSPVISNYGDALSGPFDVIVSNPPYIGDHERDDLPQDVRDYDPALALFADNHGLQAYEHLLPWCSQNLAMSGFCMIEHGSTQAQDLKKLASKYGLRRSECVFDMANLPRFLKILRN